jgi:hypothetical protein
VKLKQEAAIEHNVKKKYFIAVLYGWLQKKRELSEKVLSDFIIFL